MPTSLNAYQPTCLKAYMPTSLSTYMPTSLHAYQPICLPAYMPTSLHAYQPTFLPAYMLTSLYAYQPTCLPAYMPTSLYAYQPTCLSAYMSTSLHAYQSTFAYMPTLSYGPTYDDNDINLDARNRWWYPRRSQASHTVCMYSMISLWFRGGCQEIIIHPWRVLGAQGLPDTALYKRLADDHCWLAYNYLGITYDLFTHNPNITNWHSQEL